MCAGLPESLELWWDGGGEEGKGCRKATKQHQKNPSKQATPVRTNLDNAGGGRKTSGSGLKQRTYEWDHTHNDIEVYNERGEHLGSTDPTTTGSMYKRPVKRRERK